MPLYQASEPTVKGEIATFFESFPNGIVWANNAQINRDRRPWLQYQAGWESYTEQTDDVYGAMAAYRRFPEDLFVGSEAMKRALLEGAGRRRSGDRRGGPRRRGRLTPGAGIPSS